MNWIKVKSSDLSRDENGDPTDEYDYFKTYCPYLRDQKTDTNYCLHECYHDHGWGADKWKQCDKLRDEVNCRFTKIKENE